MVPSFFILKWWFIFFLLQQYFNNPRQRTFKIIHNNILFSRFFPRYIFLLIPFRYYKQNLLFTPTVGITSWFIFITYSTNTNISLHEIDFAPPLCMCVNVLWSVNGIVMNILKIECCVPVRYQTNLKISFPFTYWIIPFPLKLEFPWLTTFTRVTEASGTSGTLFWPTTWIISYPKPK